MAQEVLNSTNNINIADTVSAWFQQDWTGSWYELGDCVVDGVSLTPEFLEFRSYRNGLNSLRKRILSATAAEITMTLNEPNIVNLQRVTYGGTISSGDSVTVYEGRHVTIGTDAEGDYIDLSELETGPRDTTITGIYEVTDVTQATNLLSANVTPNTDFRYHFDATDIGSSPGDIVYVTYEVAMTSMYSTEIFGSSTSSIEGAFRLQVRNETGGVVQVWDLASVTLAPNGDMPLPLDGIQTIPMTATLQERSGTFGRVYAS